jgi:signal transduction histidine kinase
MASKCFMCGRDVSQGILCEKCDVTRRPKTAATPKSVPAEQAAQPQTQQNVRASVASSAPAQPASHTATAVALDPFPKAPIVPFPVESASPAITSICDVLIASGVPAVVIAPDHAIKFVTDEAKKLFETTPQDLRSIEARIGRRVGDLGTPVSTHIRLGTRNVTLSLVPLSGGAGGAVLILRPHETMSGAHSGFVSFVRETVLAPLSSLRESMEAAAARTADPFLEDSAATLDQILSSLELAPAVDDAAPAPVVPLVGDVVRTVGARFTHFAEVKGIQLQVDASDLDERLRDHEQLAESLGVLMDNALHYVPPGGQVVLGVRIMEHKGKPLLLFFVMDNGPVVPESLRQTIFESGFVWQPSAPERTGRNLSKCREFAIAHGGQVWVESKTGKACTFFLRVRPDGAR